MATERLQQLSSVLSHKGGFDCETGRKSEETRYTCKEIAAHAEGNCVVPKLSLRERQIVHLIRQAKSNKEIAFELRLTVGTVKEYVYHIFRKLGVANRTELALWGGRYLSELRPLAELMPLSPV